MLKKTHFNIFEVRWQEDDVPEIGKSHSEVVRTEITAIHAYCKECEISFWARPRQDIIGRVDLTHQSCGVREEIPAQELHDV